MKKAEKLKVMFHERTVGWLTLTPDNRLNVFEYDKSWLTDGFSISPLELPLKPGVFIAKPQPLRDITENTPLPSTVRAIRDCLISSLLARKLNFQNIDAEK
jgi:hypothetical protein